MCLDHVAEVATLPRHHRDPFERVVICQAMLEKMTIVGSDAAFDAYPIVRRW